MFAVSCSNCCIRAALSLLIRSFSFFVEDGAVDMTVLNEKG